MSSTLFTYIDSPIGELLLTGNGNAITGLTMHEHKHAPPVQDHWHSAHDGVLAAAREQLSAYFAGALQTFELPLTTQGTEFQQTVWQALLEIPYGRTWSYGQLARRIGKPGAARAVGLANGRNPISIIIPCHRVIGADGSLTGYGGGMGRKQWLLRHEGRSLGQPTQSALFV